ncbi:hypothetical protein EDC19_0729 [Natranaerovirga hydrolytica]|uniref:UPF0122 protein EDC19_0729 n=1 Tax=Natranaerovirga hydrolytica TaxID=680378 RepID=A0A4R1N5N7_9FIRM|nr:YlxM family DNA-binding protein [Natranaerovirga hydrolytica]TCK98309.1 hypothetical protein EDC19_0729 [Natranaerovirga hydrolytica]
MDKIVEQTLLYDFYSELLTKKQKKIYEDYFMNDLSLAEISEQEGISRQGVYDSIKRTTKLLGNYEEKLGLVKKFDKNTQRVNQIYKYTHSLINESELDQKELQDIKAIQEIVETMLQEM